MKRAAALRLPVFPNVFPYNDMLLDGHLRVGKFEGVKTRNWDWDYRGPVLLYNSGRTERSAAEAYGYADNAEHHKVIVGVGELIEVRELTDREFDRMICNFNNITRAQKKAYEYSIIPLSVGFFFRNLKRFTCPVPFKWPQGPVKPIYWDIKPGSKLALHLKYTGGK